MTKQTEAMKLALEAMRGVIAWHIMRNHMVPYRVRDPLQEAITAISEALAEQPAQTDWEAVAADQAMTIAMMKAERKPWHGLTDEDISKMPSWIYSPDQDGMTAEEGLEVFARAIEAKLKEKNT